MLIDLFKEDEIVDKLNYNVSRIIDRDCQIVGDLSYYSQEVAATSETNFHIRSVLESLESSRSYDKLFGNHCDSHNEVERLGVCKFCKPYTTIISFEDSLDYILHRLSGCKVSNVRNMKDYFKVSRAIMKLDFELLEGLKVEHLLGLDDNLDKYLENLLYDEEGNKRTSTEYMLSFVSSLIKEVGTICDYVGLYFKTQQNPSSDNIIRSKSFCSYIISTVEKKDGHITIRSEGFEDYTIRIRSFKRMEYLSNINLRYVE